MVQHPVLAVLCVGVGLAILGPVQRLTERLMEKVIRLDEAKYRKKWGELFELELARALRRDKVWNRMAGTMFILFGLAFAMGWVDIEPVLRELR